MLPSVGMRRFLYKAWPTPIRWMSKPPWRKSALLKVRVLIWFASLFLLWKRPKLLNKLKYKAISRWLPIFTLITKLPLRWPNMGRIACVLIRAILAEKTECVKWWLRPKIITFQFALVSMPAHWKKIYKKNTPSLRLRPWWNRPLDILIFWIN